jgi:hypothetical protein
MQLYPDSIRRPAQPADPADTSRPGTADGDPDSIDLERALWDMEYRRQALEILRRARRGDGKPPPES